MVIIDKDMIEYEPELESDDAIIAWKFPRKDIALGSKLIVSQNQEAIFLRDGGVVGTFVYQDGGHVLTTKNMPWLRRPVNFLFGGKTRHPAEVWFVNKGEKTLKWGARKVFLEEPMTKVDINVGASGTCVMQVNDPGTLIRENQNPAGYIKAEWAENMFRDRIQQRLGEVLSGFFSKRKISIYDVQDHRAELSDAIKDSVKEDFQNNGIEIIRVIVKGIGTSDEDQATLKEIKAENRKYDRLRDESPEAYRQVRSLDIMEKMAENPGGGAGQSLGASLGLGAGLSAGVSMGEKIGGAMDTQSKTNSPTESEPENNSKAKLQLLQNLLEEKLITEDDYEKKKKEILDTM
ncbi:SPFH domain-containing protein [Candidatus Poribacteria bacterium]|nr:SPFH domain-containing protein [Candidatus Poribacteria bacterium]MYG07310.1 SPFH domain-containing protein [Candidatus Poribacteria bacterium]MYK23089.1 SPFH domain-containing protein [Candidatus Poribacteria bacterium]